MSDQSKRLSKLHKKGEPAPTAAMVSRLLRESREAAGLTQTELAERLGYRQSAIQSIERTRLQRDLKIETVAKIARALGLEMVIEFREP